MKASSRVYFTLEDREGRRHKAYLDDAQLWTIGVGHRLGRSPEFATWEWTDLRITWQLRTDLDECEKIIDRAVKVKLSQNEFDALCTFVFQFGGPKFLTSTLLKKLNASDFAGAAQEFLRWDHEGEKEVASIEARRVEERDLFLTPDRIPVA